ncbi:MAG: metal ABC transporter permease [Spirochaetaceae bacterium]
MSGIELLMIEMLLRFVDVEGINAFFRDPRATATIIGVAIAVAGGVLGTFLLLRGMALTSDAISHTVLLGIVLAFMIMSGVFAMEPDLSSPWLIIGAAAAGVVTVVLTEVIQGSGLMKQDAALGLVFPFLFALAVIFVSRYVENVHIDEDAVMVGEIGLAWANTESHCIEGCEEVTITREDPRAEISRQCVNCVAEGINPRDPRAEFREVCTNCGSYTPSQAWRAGLISRRPTVVFWPKSVTVSTMTALLAGLFTLLFYKELKVSTFDPDLARSLGIRTKLLNYGLMIVVSLVAVAAFDAVGSILVIAFFIIPPATAYLLTNRLSVMLFLSVLLATASAIWGYDLARGSLFGLLDLPGNWDTSISASMVLMMLLLFFLFLLAAPRLGIVASLLRRTRQRGQFAEMVLLGHIEHHHLRDGVSRLTLAGELGWSEERLTAVLSRSRRRGVVTLDDQEVRLTDRGVRLVQRFRETNPATPA